MSTETDAPPYHPAHDEPPAEHAPVHTSSAAAAGRRNGAPPPHDTTADDLACAVAVLVAVAVVLTRGIRAEMARARAGALPPLTSDHGGHVAMHGPVRRPDFYDWAERS